MITKRNASEYQQKHIDKLNTVFKDTPLDQESVDFLIWLSGLDTSTVNAMVKAVTAVIKVERQEWLPVTHYSTIGYKQLYPSSDKEEHSSAEKKDSILNKLSNTKEESNSRSPENLFRNDNKVRGIDFCNRELR